MSSDDPWSLFDALLGLHIEWEAVLQDYTENRVRGLRVLLDPVGLSAGAYYGALLDVLRCTVAAEQLRVCLDGLELEIARAEEERAQVLYRLSKLSTAPAAQGDSSPSTSEPR